MACTLSISLAGHSEDVLRSKDITKHSRDPVLLSFTLLARAKQALSHVQPHMYEQVCVCVCVECTYMYMYSLYGKVMW